MRRDKQERCDDCNRLVSERELRGVTVDVGRRWVCDDCRHRRWLQENYPETYPKR